MIIRLAGGDARRALTYLEESAAGARGPGPRPCITTDIVEQAVDKAAIRYDRDGDQHYDVISAFIKSVRGSDVQAALHYLARMVAAGEDPRFIARRLVILASEDIGLADPTALTTAVAAADAVQFIGMPEGRINLAQAVIALALAPKSNAVIRAIGAAMADVEAGRIGLVPAHLRDAHYAGREDVRARQGLPVRRTTSRTGSPRSSTCRTSWPSARYYQPTDHGAEAALAERLRRIDELLGRTPRTSGQSATTCARSAAYRYASPGRRAVTTSSCQRRPVGEPGGDLAGPRYGRTRTGTRRCPRPKDGP